LLKKKTTIKAKDGRERSSFGGQVRKFLPGKRTGEAFGSPVTEPEGRVPVGRQRTGEKIFYFEGGLSRGGRRGGTVTWGRRGRGF